jgi:hypothetical protein
MNEGWLIATVFFIEVSLHFICDTEKLLGRKLHPIIAYVLGMLAVMVPFSFWLLEYGDCGRMHVFWALWKTIVAAGVAVLLSYGVESITDLLWKERHATERETILADQVKNAKSK